MKDLSTRYANDVIATCAFGSKVNSLEAISTIKHLLMDGIPKIARASRTDFTDNIKQLVKDTMKTRTENNIHQPDLLHVREREEMMSLQRFKLRDLI